MGGVILCVIVLFFQTVKCAHVIFKISRLSSSLKEFSRIDFISSYGHSFVWLFISVVLPRKHRDILLIKACMLYRNILWVENFDYMAEDKDLTEFVDDMNEDNNERDGTDMGDDEYNIVWICFSHCFLYYCYLFASGCDISMIWVV